MTFVCKLLPNLQKPPQYLIDKIDLTLKPKKNNVGFYAQRQLKNWYGRNFEAAQNIRIKFCYEYECWVKENIVSEFNDASLNYVDSSDNRTSTGAHTDGTREYALLFNIKTGGPNASLCFWQEIGQDIIRPKATQGEDLSKLTLLSSYIGPTDCWYLIDGRVLHSVENMTDTRINLQVSLNYDPWQ